MLGWLTTTEGHLVVHGVQLLAFLGLGWWLHVYHRQGEEYRRAIAEVIDWLHDRFGDEDDDNDDGPGPGDDPDPSPPPPDDEPDTQISHPADTFVRQQALLARYRHAGQHRSTERASQPEAS